MKRLLRHNRMLALRLRLVREYELDTLMNWAAATVVALPLALLFGDGLVFALCVGYVIGYVGVMVVPAALNLLLVYDAVRVILRRPAFWAPWVIAMVETTREEAARTGRALRLHPIARVGIIANPTSAVAAEMWGLAMRLNPGAWREVHRTAKAMTAAMRPKAPASASGVVVHEVQNWVEEVDRMELAATC